MHENPAFLLLLIIVIANKQWNLVLAALQISGMGFIIKINTNFPTFSSVVAQKHTVT